MLINSGLLSQSAPRFSTFGAASNSFESFLEKYNPQKNIEVKDLMRSVSSTEGLCEHLKFDGLKDGDLSQSEREEEQRLRAEGFFNFLAMEEEITNDQLFYMLFGYFYGLSDINTMYLDNIRDAVNRGTRKRQHINDKLKWANAVFNLGSSTSSDSIRNRMDKYGATQDMIVYRGFLCRKDDGERIRESDDKTDDSFWNQKEGLGVSYSFSREVACAFSHRWLDVKIFGSTMDNIETEDRETLGITSTTSVRELVDIIQSNYDHPAVVKWLEWGRKQTRRNRAITADELDTSYDGFGVRAVVGTYKVKKIDMVMPLNRNNELEIVALPEDVKLVRYDFLTNDEIIRGKQVGHLTS